MTLAQNSNTYFRALTGVRAVAAYAVFLVHYIPLPLKYKDSLLWCFFMEFHVGVTMFFVLSGFLIAHRYAHFTSINLKNYFVNRFARVYPMYFLLTTLSFGIWFWQKQHSSIGLFKEYLLNISFLKSFFNDFKFNGIPQAWSLTVEECFYVLAPLFFWAHKKHKSALLLLPIFLIVMGVSLSHIPILNNYHGLFQNTEFTFTFTFFGRCVEFFIGIGLAIFLPKLKEKTKHKGITYVSIVMFFAIILFMGFLRMNNYFDTGLFPIWAINTILLPTLAIAPFYFGLITEDTIISRFLSTKMMVLLGKSSYAFYLIHVGIVYTFLQQFTENNAILFLLLNAISLVLFSYIEEPLNQFLHRKLRSKT
jgi:peptidoglycan/LPS O-acetylase OafA/YrhL